MISLEQPVQYLKGVGPARAAKLARIDIHAVKDLLEYFPREWSDRRYYTSIKNLVCGQKSTVRGIIQRQEIQYVNPRLSIFHLFVRDSTGTVDAVWIRKPSGRYDVFATLTKKLTMNQDIILYGQADFMYRTIQFKTEDYELVNPHQKTVSRFNRIIPVYPLTEGIDQNFLRNMILHVFDSDVIIDNGAIPQALLEKRNLFHRDLAIREIHFPSSLERAEKARQSLAYAEFFFIEFALTLQRHNNRKKKKGHTYSIKKNILTPFKNSLSYRFTKAQKRVIREIFDDLCSSFPMNRLLQGDVGSGKTVVALSSMLLAVENGYQASLMVPTEILAEQHYYSITALCRNLPVKIGLIKSKMPRKERDILLSEAAGGAIDILIGTHALIQDDVQFKNLTLVVIDEQHRFGVIQRACLKLKGTPDMLVMTATPIPRTLALTVYGNLDVSLLDEMPPGRKAITTLHIAEREAYDIIHREVSLGHQVYIVYPLIEESEKKELRSVVKEWNQLKNTVFKSYRVGLLHGQMAHRDKDTVMNELVSGNIDILISTTVIEVGIDIPNATVMLIQHADRFGLATLHQLRGRVGRGDKQSFCLLIGKPQTPQAVSRMNVMQETSDGFRIGEEDLRLRGPGEFLGTAQHGLPHLKAGNLLTDKDIIHAAREDASLFFKENISEQSCDFNRLFNSVKNRFGSDMHLAQIG